MVNEEIRYTFRMIEHYHNRDPRYLRFTATASITFDEFIEKILHEMTRESLINIYKINITQYCEDATQILPFINECRGELDINNPESLSIRFDEIRRSLLS